MHRDPTLRKRNALVIPGVLLVLLCSVGILYAQGLRPDNVACEDGRMVVFAGACRSATLLLVIPLAVGALLVILGARIRSGRTCHLGHGTVATTGLAVLIAMVVLPLLAAGALIALEDPDAPYVTTYKDIDFSTPKVLAAAGLLLLVPLVPYTILYAGRARPRACCRVKGCFEPCYCDEDAAPPMPDFPQAVAPAPPMPAKPAVLPPTPPRGETAQVTTTAWTGPRPPAPPVDPLAAPPAEPAVLPPPPKEEPPRPLVHDIWPETHRHDSTFDSMAKAPPALAPPPEAAAAEPEPAAQEEAEPARAGKKAAKKPPKKAASRKRKK